MAHNGGSSITYHKISFQYRKSTRTDLEIRVEAGVEAAALGPGGLTQIPPSNAHSRDLGGN